MTFVDLLTDAKTNSTLTWKSVARDTYAMPFTTRPNMSATGIRPLPLISPKNGLRASITMSHFPMLQEIGSADICYGKIRYAVPFGRLTSF